MDRPSARSAKCNKLDTEGPVLHDSFMRQPEQENAWGQTGKCNVQGLGQRRNGELLLPFSACDVENVLEIDNGNG